MKLKDLSQNASVESILGDIPFFAVGLMAFGIFTFFLLIGAVSRWVVAIHLASVIGFVASILDLSDILIHGSPTQKEPTSDLVLGPLGTAREVLYAVSQGVLFIFLWLLVAHHPPNEYTVDADGLHSGSWGKWGILGTILKWSLATAAVAITILQILYRVVPALHVIGPIYQVECTIRIIVSAVLVLKILLNTYLAVLSSRQGIPRWKTLRDYTPAILAIILGMALAIGDLVHFMLSSNVLGTFLNGVEMYILLLYVLISSFYHIRHELRGARKNHLRSSSFNALRPMTQTDAFLRMAPAPVSQAQYSSDFLSLGPSGESGEGNATRPPPSTSYPTYRSNLSAENARSQRRSILDGRRGSAASRLSTWLNPRNLTSRLPSFSSAEPQPDDERLWDQDEAERGLSPTVQELEVKAARSSPGTSPLEPKESAKWQDPMFTSVLRETPSNPNFRGKISPTPQSLSSLTPLTIPPRVFTRPLTPVSGTDSPVYGLGGIIARPPQATESPSSILTPPPRIPLPEPPQAPSESGENSRATSISYLFREQAELDKTIANLKGLSGSISSSTSSDSNPILSASQSEFSLSNFPTPPLRGSVAVGDMSRILAAAGITENTFAPMTAGPGDRSSVASSRSSGTVRGQDSRESRESKVVEQGQEAREAVPDPQVESPSPTMSELSPPQMPVAAEHSRTISVPYSDDGNDSLVGATRFRTSSQGTQFEITSFIGDLTRPGQPQSGNSIISPGSSTPGTSPLRALGDNPLLQGGSPNMTVSPLTALQMSTRPTLRIPAMAGVPISRPMMGLPSGPRLATRSGLSPLRERMSPDDEFEHPRPAPVPAPATTSPTGNSSVNSRAPTP